MKKPNIIIIYCKELARTLCEPVGIDRLAQFNGSPLFAESEPEAIFSTGCG